jgi:aminoglycoside 3-N-acetyltransferase I
MSVEIKLLSKQDIYKFKELIQLFEDVFEMESFHMPDDIYLQQLLGNNRFFVFVALSDNNIVGGLTAYTLQQYYSKLPLVYIYDVAIKTEFQRQGIGRMLITSITKYCQEIGVEEVFVQADEVDDYAIEFYTSTGARNEKVRHFYYPLNTQ